MSHRRAIGLITRFISGRFFEQFMSGLQAVAWQHQVDVLVILGTPENVASTQIAKQRVDGWLVLTYTQGFELLVAQGKPMVTVSCQVPHQPFPAVFPDNRQGMESIMEHLLARGHKRIAFVGDTSIGDIQERYTTYQSVLAQHGIPVDQQLIIRTDNPLADRGALAASRLVENHIPCTAVVAGNDWTAIGLMREFQVHGIRIPDDVAIVGFDDIPEAQITNPPLSTVRQRIDELGATAARLLLSQIAGQSVEPKTYYIPTTFIPRESSGNSLLNRISQWIVPEITPGSAWQAVLSRDLVRVLLPALPQDPTPSPAQVWPEVDKLVQLLAETIDNPDPQTLDPHLLNAVFSSTPILNANPEILVEMLRVLEVAGATLIADRSDSERARQRLSALLDQLHIEIMRSYRRRQTSSQRTLQEVLQSQYNISQLLLQCPPEQINWLKETPMFTGCLGLWAPSGGDQSPNLAIAGWFHREESSLLRAGMIFSAPQFPPLDLLPSTPEPNSITTCLVLNVQTADHDWGVLAVSGPLLSYDPWLEDNTINTLEICSGFLGIALERETLQESWRRSSEYEQALADHVRKLTYPVISLKDGVFLIPLAGLLAGEQSPQSMTETINDILKQPTSDLFLDLRGISVVNEKLERTLIEIARTVTTRGTRVTLIGARADIQERLVDKELALAGIHNQSSIALALEHLDQM
jgi:DNA-binding LacI/PurR family transcriptional regulator/anti-anti-sigma regulatory factor